MSDFLREKIFEAITHAIAGVVFILFCTLWFSYIRIFIKKSIDINIQIF
jgi:hypothetical protein